MSGKILLALEIKSIYTLVQSSSIPVIGEGRGVCSRLFEEVPS